MAPRRLRPAGLRKPQASTLAGEYAFQESLSTGTPERAVPLKVGVHFPVRLTILLAEEHSGGVTKVIRTSM